MDCEVIWEVTLSQFEQLGEYADMLANASISQQDYVERLRSMGMPTCGPGTHVRIVLRMGAKRITTAAPRAGLLNGQLPGLPY